MNKNCILTPTFIGHFQYITPYLKSFDKYVIDKKDIPIFFIISQREKDEFSKIIAPFSHLNINVVMFEDILKEFNINENPDELLKKYGRFSFQTMKKLYGMLYLKDYRYFCVLDSEAIWVNPTNMHELIDNFNKSPFITYSHISDREIANKQNMMFADNINYILNDNHKLWFVEQFYRYWNSNILRDIVKKYGSIYEMVVKIYNKEKAQSKQTCGLFESVLYDQFVYDNLEKYGYRAIDIGEALRKYLSKDDYKEYMKRYEGVFKYEGGISEHMPMFLNKKNVKGIVKMCNDLNFDVFRIDESNIDNYKYQKYLLDKVKPKMLVCSQGHAFVDRGFYKIFFRNKYLYKLIKHIKLFYAPFKHLLRYITDCIGIFYYLIRYILKIFTNILKYVFSLITERQITREKER